MTIALLASLVGGCAGTSLPESAGDAAVSAGDVAGEDVGVDAQTSTDVGDVRDVGVDAPPADIGDPDGASCVPSTCQELDSCGMRDDGCGASLDCGPCAGVDTVELAPMDNQTAAVGDTLSVTAVARDADNQQTYCEFDWTTQDPTVARVDSDGLVSAVGVGMTDIEASCQSASAKLRLYVNNSELPAALTDSEALVMWFRADVGLGFSSAAQVEQWEDLSGNALVAKADSFSQTPQRVNEAVHSRPVLRFSGNQELHLTADPPALSVASIFAVVKKNAPSQAGQILAGCAPGPTNQFGFDATSTGLYFLGAQLGLDDAVDFGESTTNYRLISAVLSDAQLRVFRDGQQQAAVAREPGGTWSFGHIGARCGSEPLRGDIAEIMVYDEALDSADRQQVAAYLAGRYGL